MSGTSDYELLGVPPDAEPEEIRRAYLDLVKVWHPDRFTGDARLQAKAGRRLRAINEAYRRLRAPDEGQGATHESNSGQDEARHQNPRRDLSARRAQAEPGYSAPSDSGDSGKPSPGRATFDSLGQDVRDRLLMRQSGQTREQAWVATDRVLRHVVLLSLCSLWFPVVLFLAQDERWSTEMTRWVFGLSVGAGVLVGWQLDWLYRLFSSPLKPRVYATPLYVIETLFSEVRWWPIWTISDFKATHQYQNGAYQNTAVNFDFGDSAASFSLSPRDAAEGFLTSLQQFDSALREAVRSKDWSYFVRHDDFRGVPQSTPGTLRVPRGVGLAVGVLISVGIWGSGLTSNSELPPMTGPPPVTQPVTGPFGEPTLPREQSASLPPGRIAFAEPPLPLPLNGSLSRYHVREAMAPLEVRTRGSDHHYFIKLVDYHSDSEVLTVFVRAGQTIDIEVPLGSMKMRYAVGSTWYGKRFLFGPETTYAEANARFDFSQQPDRITGYTVELFLQPDGNLSERRIRPDQW